MEIWKDVKGYEGYYAVSSLGRVKSLSRPMKIRRKHNAISKERILKPLINPDGYSMVTLSVDGKRKSFQIHQLMAIAFLNHKPNGHVLVVDHIDNNNSNNTIHNLQVITKRKNNTKDSKNKNGFTGVSRCRKKFQAKIHIGGDNVYLGTFDTPYQAHQAYQQKLATL